MLFCGTWQVNWMGGVKMATEMNNWPSVAKKYIPKTFCEKLEHSCFIIEAGGQMGTQSRKYEWGKLIFF